MLQDAFLKFIAQEIFKNIQDNNEQFYFSKAWHPEYYKDSNYRVRIAEELNKKLNKPLDGDYSTKSNSLSEPIRRIAQKIWKTFATEMIQDGFFLENQATRENTYQWLWTKKFPRVAWDLAVKTATLVTEDTLSLCDYHQPITVEDRISTRVIPQEELLYKNTDYRLRLNLDSGGNLLLINQSADGNKYLIAPSKAFAEIPVTVINHILYLPPDKKANRAPISFETEKELFLGIVTTEEIKLSWIAEDYRNEDVELNEMRLEEIFQEVGKLSNCQVFQRGFRVGEK